MKVLFTESTYHHQTLKNFLLEQTVGKMINTLKCKLLSTKKFPSALIDFAKVRHDNFQIDQIC